MDMVFRKIEYWIEGDAGKQKMLDKQPWNAEKIRKKTIKIVIFYLVSFVFVNVFLSYIIGMDSVRQMISEPVSKNIGTLIGIMMFSFVFFLVYLRFREQVCIVVCPYGRLQGVLLDKNSILVAYDYLRGEPRSKYKKSKDSSKGDCIDCHHCVDVCPTGIDIRNGTQLECINCTACIDACDSIMEAVGSPKGLIRYDSEFGIANKEKLKITPRIIAYCVVLTLLIGVLITLLATRTDVETTIFRTPGLVYQDQPNNKISNLYNIKIINKTRDDKPIFLKMETPGTEIQMVGKDTIKLSKQNIATGEFFIMMDRAKINAKKTTLSIGVYCNGTKISTAKTNFLGPIAK
jgi:cytochrome c oxidase accessory protein FixG